MKRWILRGLQVLVVLPVVIQLVPYGRNHTNPPITSEPAWSDAETRSLAFRACFDCHSNETTWPWYTNVAPVSWLAQRDVVQGRDELNYSEWDGSQEGDESAEKVLDGSMPPWFYLLTHPEARLSDAETRTLVQGLRATFGEKADESGEGSDEDDD
jgi:hypothetical protein